jgi:FkbM family methyltransferase
MARKAAKRKQTRGTTRTAAKKATPVVDPGKSKEVFQAALEQHRKGDTTAALAGYAESAALDPGFAEPLINAGVIHRLAGELDKAADFYRKALDLAPDHAGAHYNLANVLKDRGENADATVHYRRALEIEPDYAAARANLAILLKDAGKLKEARALFDRAFDKDPDNAELRNALGVVLWESGQREAAIACYRRSIARAPNSLHAPFNLANALMTIGRYEEAMTLYRRVLEIDPNYVGAYSGMGQTLTGMGRLDEAIAVIEKALSLDPDYLDAHLGMARASLLKGDLPRGWEEYEWRWKRADRPPRFLDRPLWDGKASLKGKTVLLQCEQGLGDSIQFVRYVPMLAEKGATILLETQPGLMRLFQCIDGVAKLIREGGKVPEFDYRIPLLTLPKLFGTALETIPAPKRYLEPPQMPELRLPPARNQALRVGIAWAGRPEHKNDHNRSVELIRFLEMTEIAGIEFFSLQKGRGEGDIAKLSCQSVLTDCSGDLFDMGDTAAMVDQLDLVITVDTSLAHLAGALGKPVWVLVPHAPDWRWLLGRDDTPWYPSMRLMRQPAPGEWDPVFARVRKELEAIVARRRTKAINTVEDRGDSLVVPSVFKLGNGNPAFRMPVPKQYLDDAGVGFLVRHESQFGGYEYPARRFIIDHLAPGDLFIDIGAHWGIFTLSAVAAYPGRIKALAIEPLPDNVAHMRQWLAFNNMERQVDLVQAAAGSGYGEGVLFANSSMGHSLVEGNMAPGAQGREIRVPIASVDNLLAQRPDLQGRPAILKIDVEGVEPEVVDGAWTLVEAGLVKAIMWEKGRNYDERERFEAMIRMADKLSRAGFSHYRFPHEQAGGPLVPWIPTSEMLNVFSVAKGVELKTRYAKPFAPTPRMFGADRARLPDEQAVRVTEELIKQRGTDGGRWGLPELLPEGATERAAAAARLLPATGAILDIGAGTMELRKHLPKGAGYQPLDLTPTAASTIVMDLNRGHFPAGRCAAAAALHLLCYIHDPNALLARIGQATDRLVLSYPVCTEGADRRARRALGYVNDLTAEQLDQRLATTGWKVTARETAGGDLVVACERAGA